MNNYRFVFSQEFQPPPDEHTAVLPAEFYIVARLIAKRTGQSVDRVASDFFKEDVLRLLASGDPAAMLECGSAPAKRYCEAEGLDVGEYTFRTFQMVLKKILKRLRKETWSTSWNP